MKQNLQKYTRLFLITTSLSLCLWLIANMMIPTTPAYAELPPRPGEEATAQPEPTATAVPESELINGVQLKLVVADAAGNEWTAVQWQDPHTDEWHTVEGWQGTLEADGSQSWWAGSEHLGQGPFRWLLFAGKDGLILDISEEFFLPNHNKQVVTVTIPSVQD